MYVNGRFGASIVEDYGGNVLSYTVVRPDIAYNSKINTTVFTSAGGICSRAPGGMFDAGDMIANLLPITGLKWGEIELADCKEKKFNDRKCTRGYVKILGVKTDFPLYFKDGDLYGFEDGKTEYEFEWGSSAPMSKFSFSKSEVYKCPDEKVYDSGDDDYVFCAAYTVKAALAVVLAAIATALLSLF